MLKDRKMVTIVNPRQVVLITCRAHMEIMGKVIEKDDIQPTAWHMPVSADPFTYAIAIGKEKYAARIIEKSKCFVVNFISHESKDVVLFCAKHHGEHVNKMKTLNMNLLEAKNIDCPFLEITVAHLECEVINEMETGDHKIFFGKVVFSNQKNEAKRLFQLDREKFTTTVD